MGINNSLLKSIQTIVNKAIEIAPFDKTRQGQIVSNNSDGTYTLRLDGILYNNIPSYPMIDSIEIGTVVKVKIPSNQSSQMYIITSIDRDTTPEISTLVDTLYPVGSVYETNDIYFNPNTDWGDLGFTWILEDEYSLVAWASVNNNVLTGSKNISSITNLGTASANTITFSTPMADTNYIVSASGEASGIGSEILGIYNKTVNGFNFDHANSAGTAVILSYFTLGIWGKLTTPEKHKWIRTA